MKRRFFIKLFVLLMLGIMGSAFAARDVALVLKVRGEARVRRSRFRKTWKPLRKGYRLHGGDRVRTGSDALVAIVFSDDKSLMKIRSESEVAIRGERTKKGFRKRISMSLGQLWAKVTPGGGGFRVETPSGVAAVKGTEFYLLCDESGMTTVIGIEGIVQLFNELGSVMVGKGQTGVLKKNQKPSVEKSQKVEDWAGEDEGGKEIQIEFENDEGTKKQLKIRYKE